MVNTEYARRTILNTNSHDQLHALNQVYIHLSQFVAWLAGFFFPGEPSAPRLISESRGYMKDRVLQDRGKHS